MANELSYKASLVWGGQASEALTAYTAVAIDYTTSALSYVASAGDRADGIVIANIASGEDAQVIIEGIVPAKIGTASGVAVGDLLMSGTNGTLVEATSTNVAIAQALQAPSADGDLILVRLIPAYTVPA